MTASYPKIPGGGPGCLATPQPNPNSSPTLKTQVLDPEYTNLNPELET